jgi:hypothetical protein
MALSFPEAGPKANVIGRFCVGCEVVICDFVQRAAEAFDKPELSTQERDQEIARSAEFIPEDCAEGGPLRSIMRTPIADQ